MRPVTERKYRAAATEFVTFRKKSDMLRRICRSRNLFLPAYPPANLSFSFLPLVCSIRSIAGSLSKIGLSRSPMSSAALSSVAPQ
jgi:hypothetical protein